MSDVTQTVITTGRAWCLGPNVDTDALAPGHAMSKGIEVIARHCLEDVRPEFSTQVQAGDCLVAGAGFGIGSSREQAASVLFTLGVRAVIAPSFSGLYFRNAFNVGLLLVTCPRATDVADGDALTVAINPGDGVTVTSAQLGPLEVSPIPDFLLRRVLLGGLLNELKELKLKENHV